jgi:hypothetical protein
MAGTKADVTQFGTENTKHEFCPSFFFGPEKKKDRPTDRPTDRPIDQPTREKKKVRLSKKQKSRST